MNQRDKQRCVQRGGWAAVTGYSYAACAVIKRPGADLANN